MISIYKDPGNVTTYLSIDLRHFASELQTLAVQCLNLLKGYNSTPFLAFLLMVIEKQVKEILSTSYTSKYSFNKEYNSSAGFLCEFSSDFLRIL
jgi:hypothetical protein